MEKSTPTVGWRQRERRKMKGERVGEGEIKKDGKDRNLCFSDSFLSDNF